MGHSNVRKVGTKWVTLMCKPMTKWDTLMCDPPYRRYLIIKSVTFLSISRPISIKISRREPLENKIAWWSCCIVFIGTSNLETTDHKSNIRYFRLTIPNFAYKNGCCNIKHINNNIMLCHMDWVNQTLFEWISSLTKVELWCETDFSSGFSGLREK